MKRLGNTPYESTPSQKIQKVESAELLSLPDDLLGHIIAIIFQECKSNATYLSSISHQFKRVITTHPGSRWVYMEKKLLLGMKRTKIPHFVDGDLAYAKMLLHNKSGSKEAYKILPLDMDTEVIHDFRRAMIEKQMAAGNLEKARLMCKKADKELLFQINYLLNKKTSKTAEDYFKEFIFGDLDWESLPVYWNLMTSLDPKAAFSVFEQIALEEDEAYLGNCLPAALLNQDWKRSFDLCSGLRNETHLRYFLCDIFKVSNEKVYLDSLEKLGISPREFTILASKYCHTARFYTFASFFIKTHRADEVVSVADKILSKVSREYPIKYIWYACYLYASIESAEVKNLGSFASKILSNQSIILQENEQKILQCLQFYLINTNNTSAQVELYRALRTDTVGLMALIPYLSKFKLPIPYLLTASDFYLSSLGRDEICIESLKNSLIEYKQTQESSDNNLLIKNSYLANGFLCFMASIDIDMALAVLRSGAIKPDTYKIDNSLRSIELDLGKWENTHHEFVGLLVMGYALMQHNFINQDSIRKIGSALLKNETLLDLVQKESLHIAKLLSEQKASVCKIRMDVLAIFKWCDIHLKNSSFTAQYIKKVELIAERIDDPSLNLWLAEEAKVLASFERGVINETIMQ